MSRYLLCQFSVHFLARGRLKTLELTTIASEQNKKASLPITIGSEASRICGFEDLNHKKIN